HDIADARIEIDRLLQGKAVPRDSDAQVPSNSSSRRWLFAALFFIGGVAAALALWPSSPRPAAFPPVRFSIPVSQTNSITQVAVSPDGRKIAYVAGNAQGVRLIWIRDIDNATARPLEGAEDPGGLFWSPENERIAFFAQQELRIVDVRSGDIQTV